MQQKEEEVGGAGVVGMYVYSRGGRARQGDALTGGSSRRQQHQRWLCSRADSCETRPNQITTRAQMAGEKAEAEAEAEAGAEAEGGRHSLLGAELQSVGELLG